MFFVAFIGDPGLTPSSVDCKTLGKHCTLSQGLMSLIKADEKSRNYKHTPSLIIGLYNTKAFFPLSLETLHLQIWVGFGDLDHHVTHRWQEVMPFNPGMSGVRHLEIEPPHELSLTVSLESQ